MKGKNRIKRDLLLETNRRLQETAQKLYMDKGELERELNALKHLAGLPAGRAVARIKKEAKPIPEKKLTRGVAEDLSLGYIHLLESYVKTKDLNKSEALAGELCQKFIEYDITPKGIIGIHLKSVPQIKTMGDLETKRITFESRMVLLKVITTYASLLHEKLAEPYGTVLRLRRRTARS